MFLVFTQPKLIWRGCKRAEHRAKQKMITHLEINVILFLKQVWCCFYCGCIKSTFKLNPQHKLWINILTQNMLIISCTTYSLCRKNNAAQIQQGTKLVHTANIFHNIIEGWLFEHLLWALIMRYREAYG